METDQKGETALHFRLADPLHDLVLLYFPKIYDLPPLEIFYFKSLLIH